VGASFGDASETLPLLPEGTPPPALPATELARGETEALLALSDDRVL